MHACVHSRARKPQAMAAAEPRAGAPALRREARATRCAVQIAGLMEQQA